ncbi:MAG TPA: hypothetical protein VJP80_02595 [Candidatus Saccharimonadales bacterium]|nr:hypothetical protein [Candidatus Saccharimonadales bacterium]
METNRIVINQEINVPELYFERGHERQLKGYPRRMEWKGREYTFMEGLRLLVQKGARALEIFDMTDGQRDYRLTFDRSECSWTLVDMSA